MMQTHQELDQEISALLEELNSTDVNAKSSSSSPFSSSVSPNSQQSRFLEQETFIRQQTTTLESQDENLSTDLNPKFEGFLQEVAKMYNQQLSQHIKTGAFVFYLQIHNIA